MKRLAGIINPHRETVPERLINIVHLSDLHFGSDQLVYSDSELRMGIVSVAQEIGDPELLLLITGDITFRGRKDGYVGAQRFFPELIEQTQIRTQNVLLCPGNHDIVDGTFELFDAFSYGIRRDRRFVYSEQSCSVYEVGATLFLGINSVFRHDHTCGVADLDSIDKALRALAKRADQTRVAFLHHHLINQFDADISALRNAYPLLMLLDEHGFDYIFHGHQHANQSLPIGRSAITLFGVRTLNFATKGFFNGLNAYRISNNGLVVRNYVYSRDVSRKGAIGGFACVKSEEIPRPRR